MIQIINFPSRLHLVVLLFFLFGNIFAQNNDPSRLRLEKKRDEILAHSLDNPKESLAKLQQLQDEASKNKDLYFANHCDILMALLCYSTADYQKTLEYGNIAIEETKVNNFMDLQSIAMGVIAMQYAKVGLHEDAIRTGVEAIKLAESKNTKIFIEAQYNVTLFYSQVLNECDSKKYALDCIKLDEKTVQLAQKINNKKYIQGALLNLSQSYIENEQYEKAKKVNQQILNDKTRRSDYMNMYLYDRVGGTYLLTKQADSAIYYLSKGLSFATKLNMPEDKMNFLRKLREAYKEKQDSKEKQNISMKYDEIIDYQTSKKVDALQTSVKSVIQKNQKKQESKISFFKIVAFASFILIIFLLCLYYIYYTRFRKQKLSVEAQQKIIKEKQEKISQLKSQLEHNALDEIIQYAVEDNPIFLKRYKEVYPVFFEKLNSLSTELTMDDLKCCAMLHLNFSTKEIASYTHTLIRTIENRKFRIRKKINVLDSQKDLNEFLINL